MDSSPADKKLKEVKTNSYVVISLAISEVNIHMKFTCNMISPGYTEHCTWSSLAHMEGEKDPILSILLFPGRKFIRTDPSDSGMSVSAVRAMAATTAIKALDPLL